MRLGVLVVLALAACGERAAGPARPAEASPEVEVFVVPAAGTQASRPYTVSSTLAVEHEADLLADEEGRLVEVLADQGQRVTQGTTLARFDDAKLRKQLDQDSAEMKMLEVQSREAEVLRQAAEVELQRQTELRKEGLGSLRDYDRARFSLEAMRQRVEMARFEYERAKAKVEAGELRLSRMQLKAPFDGIVARRYARVGQMLLQNEKVFRVTELRPLLVRFTVPEYLRSAVDTGATVEVAPADLPGAVQARVVRTSFVVDAASGAVECTARLVGPLPGSLVPGMAAEVRIAGPAGGAGAVWIPASAVRRGPDGSAEIFSLAGDRLVRRSVKLGRETAAEIQVLHGLAPGDRVVVRVTEKLQDGMPVRVR